MVFLNLRGCAPQPNSIKCRPVVRTQQIIPWSSAKPNQIMALAVFILAASHEGAKDNQPSVKNSALPYHDAPGPRWHCRASSAWVPRTLA